MKLNKILLMLFISIFVSTSSFAWRYNNIRIGIDGKEVYTDVSPEIINNRTLVPIRAIFEAIEGDVEWNNDTQTATAIKGSQTMKFQLGNIEADINGEKFILDVAAKAVNGRTLVPVRFVAENLGYDVDWDHRYKRVVIRSKESDGGSKYTNENYFKINRETGEIITYNYDYGYAPKDVVVPETIDGVTVRGIGRHLFHNTDITSVILPSGLTNIGESAFYNNKLTSVTIPKGVKNIGKEAFSFGRLTSLIIEEGVTSIGESAFSFNDLTSVEIPKGVRSIENRAFTDNKLTSVEIPKGITIIEDNVFSRNRLSSVTIPEGVTSIGVNAFSYNQLTSIELPESIRSIGSFSFGYNSLVSVEIPKVVTDLADGAFDNDVEIIRK